MSAAVDRTHRVRGIEFADANPHRWHVVRAPWGVSVVYLGQVTMLLTYDHAEAIAYADRMAREEVSRG